MKTFIVEEEYTALWVYEVEAKSKKEAQKIYWETSPIDDREFDSKVTTITTVKRHEDGSYSKVNERRGTNR